MAEESVCPTASESMKFITALAALTLAAAPGHAGFAWVRVGSSTYCEARAMGMSHVSAKNVAIQKAQSPTVVDGSDLDYYNAGVMINMIEEKCGEQWSAGEKAI